MANLWENIKRKLDQGAPKAQSADWEAMSQKIGAYPQLSPKAAKPWWVIATAVVVPVALFILSYNFWPSQNDNLNANELNQPKIESTGPSVLPQKKDRNRSKNNLKSSSPAVEAKVSSADPASKAKTKLPNPENKLPKSKAKTQPEAAGAANATSESMASAPNVDEETRTRNGLNIQSQKADVNNDLRNETTAFETNNNDALSQKHNEDVTVDNSENRQSKGEANIESNEATKNSTANNEIDVAKAEPSLSESDSVILASAKARNTTERQATTNDNSQSENTAPVSPEKNNFYKQGLGLKLHSLDFGGMALSPIKQLGTLASAGGVTLNLKRQKFRLSAGVFVGRSWVNTDFTTSTSFKQIDSSLVTRLETREEIRVTTVWVIDSFFSGRYVSDTTLVVVTDTVVETVFDTTDVTANNFNTKTVQISFAEIPLLAGYEWQRGRWGFQLRAGAVLNQVATRQGVENETFTNFGLDAILQPGVSYRFSSNFGLYSRWGLRQNVIQNAFLGPTETRFSWQLGLSYYFK